MNVVVPLGGVGSRFQKEGYLTRGKPFVPVLGKEMILWVLDNLTIAADDALVIIFNPGWMSMSSFMREVVQSRYPTCTLVELPGPTRGAAETVLIGLRALPEEAQKRPTLLADGDTFYTADVVGHFRSVAATHNACFCFHDTQPKPIYSYLELDDSDNIKQVKEKIKISDWANTGCYCFRDGAQLASECEELIKRGETQLSQDQKGEFYTSGVIAAMIEKGEPFKGLKLQANDFHVLGTPEQVEAFCASWTPIPQKRIVFDMEGALFVECASVQPIARNVEMCQLLAAQGHAIVVHTVRKAESASETEALLRDHKIPFNEVVYGKPQGDFYVGGSRSVDGVLGDLSKHIGFYPAR
eukprot:gnl/TRDRNA2_/TRDRNA2_81514_c0_seq2.p1 gnl/TRDRNA2_/TRDRNA2_81514_c0~~gnl/TRDRNA2_/TRDRNA2_81514_c0_seq2.p1  ORF type:complete len:384 (+),score=72.33 gnl/TRDRNA2_/TRDRNA2_81514_c0_seq2:90-1154(+)